MFIRFYRSYILFRDEIFFFKRTNVKIGLYNIRTTIIIRELIILYRRDGKYATKLPESGIKNFVNLIFGINIQK